jgi:TetR/AcrR family transcriptional regulator, cholesterol catabolism regulator
LTLFPRAVIISLNGYSMKETGQPNSRDIRAGERRLQILDTALAVFAEKGFATTTVKDIAAAAGISDGLLYHYFPGKKELLEAVVVSNSFLPQFREILKERKNQTCRKVLGNISIKFLDLLDQKNTLVKIFFREAFSNPNVRAVWSELVNEGFTLLKQYLDERIEAGELRSHDTGITARCLLSSLVMFHVTSDIFKNSHIGKSQFVDELLDNILSGISAKP